MIFSFEQVIAYLSERIEAQRLFHIYWRLAELCPIKFRRIELYLINVLKVRLTFWLNFAQI